MQKPPADLSPFPLLTPACPPSPLNPQLSQFPNSMILFIILFFFFGVVVVVVVFLLLSPPPPPPFRSSFWWVWSSGEEVEAGGGTERRRKSRGLEEVTFAALWLTTCVSGSLYLHVSHGKEGGGMGWRERKGRHMVLVCWVKFRVVLFVSCDEQREIQIWLFPRQQLDFSLK